MRDLSWISCFCCFSCAFHRKCWFSCKKFHISWKPTKPGQYVCIHVPFTHTFTTTYHWNITIWPSLCTLWKTRSKWEICIESAVFCCFSGAFQSFDVHFLKSALLFIQKVPLFMKINKTRSICVHTCTIYTYMYCQIPPKYKIYLVGLPSVLYETLDPKWEICLESLAFVAFHVLFIESAGFHTKSATFHENQQNQVNMCVYMYHLYIHAPPHTNKKWYTYLAFPLYSMKDQVKMRDLCWISCFCCFSGAF